MTKCIIVDTREKQKAIAPILEAFDKAGVGHISSKLLFGDYMDFNRPQIVVDRKQNIAELAKNVTVERDRFIAEIERAQAVGSKLVFLVEQNKYKDRGRWVFVKDITDIMLWSNPHTTIRGEKVYRVLSALVYKYNISVIFCNKSETGKKILEIIYE